MVQIPHHCPSSSRLRLCRHDKAQAGYAAEDLSAVLAAVAAQWGAVSLVAVADPMVVLSSVVHLVQHVLYSLRSAVVLSAVVLSAVVLSSLIVEVGVPLVGSWNDARI